MKRFYVIAALLLLLGVAGVGYTQDFGDWESPTQEEPAPQNPVQKQYADGKVIAVIHSPRHYGYHIGDPVSLELPRLAQQSRGMRERTHGDRSVVGRHAAELVARNERRLRAQVGRAQGRGDAGRAGADDEHIGQASLCGPSDRLVPSLKSRSALSCRPVGTCGDGLAIAPWSHGGGGT